MDNFRLGALAFLISMVLTGLSWLFDAPRWLLPIELVVSAALVMFAIAKWSEITERHRAARYCPVPHSSGPIDVTSADASTDSKEAPDEKTLEALIKLLPNDAVVKLQGQQFWSRFEWNMDKVLLAFLQGTAGPEHGFLDEQLEILRQGLREQISVLLDRVHRYSDPSSSVIKSDKQQFRYLWKQPGEEISSLDARRNEMYEAAKNACRIYDDLVLTARRKFQV